MKKYKSLVVDFDGTLVDENFNLSPQLKKSISGLINNGYSFSIATGRLYQGIVKKICKDLQLKAPQIVSGGAEIIDPTTDKLVWYQYIDSDSAKKIIQEFLDTGYHFAVESGKYIYTPSGISIREYGDGIVFKKINEVDINLVSKIILLEGINNIKLKQEEERLANIYPKLHITRAGIVGSPVLDITSSEATKHLAVLELSKILKIDPKDMIGVGDNYNDYPLLSVCGFKVAMENAPKELKDIADMVVPDVNHDGLAVLINKL